MGTGVFVDANVRFSRTLRDWLFLLRNQGAGSMFTVYSSEDVIAETIYRIRRDRPTASGELITAIHDRISAQLDCRVTEYAIPAHSPLADEHDFHVHAAAVSCEAGILLTADRGFLDLDQGLIDVLPYEVHSPDSFFVLVDESSPATVRAVTLVQLDYWFSRDGHGDLPARLRAAGCLEFAARVAVHIRDLGWIAPGNP